MVEGVGLGYLFGKEVTLLNAYLHRGFEGLGYLGRSFSKILFFRLFFENSRFFRIFADIQYFLFYITKYYYA